MALDTVSRQYADKLFHQRMEEILKEQTSDLVKVRQDHAARNMTMSGNYFTAQAQVYTHYAELLAEARVNSLLDAYKKSGTPIDDPAFAAIDTEVVRYCEAHSRNILQALTNGIGQTFGNQTPGGFREAISSQVVSQITGVSARVRRKLSILQDEAKLAARNAAASQAAAQTDERQTVAAPIGALEPHKPVPHAKPHLYYWRFFLEFGQECYRTWRWELFASLGVSFVTYLITKGDDPLAWRNFQTVFLATALTLGGFGIWHLIRTPWIVHRSLQSPEESQPHWSLGIVGIAVLATLIVGALLSVDHINGPPPPLVKFAAPPPPVITPSGPQLRHRPDANRQNDTVNRLLPGQAGPIQKRPADVHLLYGQNPLEGQTLIVGRPLSTDFTLSDLHARNDGEMSTSLLHARLYFSVRVSAMNPYWKETKSEDSEYPYEFYYESQGTIGPSEVYNLEPDFQGLVNDPSWSNTNAEPITLRAKLKFFCGDNTPVVASFSIRKKR